MMKKLMMLMVAFCMCSVLSGCATIFGDHDHSVMVTSNPPRSTVYLNGQAVGRTPQRVVIDNTFGSHTITVSKKGYASRTKPVETIFQPVGLLNIFFWPGFIVDAVTGNMVKVSSKNMNFNLPRA